MCDDLLKKFFGGDSLAASRLMSVAERGGPDAEVVLGRIFPKLGRAYRVGITGPTGSGKSTLIDAMTERYRENNLTVGVVAEDPTSPFSGGAILGDRIRMTKAAGDPGVFIRSIASRGSETGFSALADELADILDAFGREVVLLETIGVGQLEHNIRFSASTIVVVLTPEGGDDVQNLKSGLTEIGDVFVVNKSDRPNAGRFDADLKATLELRFHDADWKPPVLRTVAHRAEGVDELIKSIADHRRYLETEGLTEKKRLEGLQNRLRRLVSEKINGYFWGNSYIQKRFDGMVKSVAAGEMSPYEASRKLVDSLKINKEQGK